MDELQLLRKIQARFPPFRPASLVLGIGDDCAIYRPRGAREDLLLTTDLMIEDVHFRRDTHPASAVGYKTLARGLSDIAAMGGEPRFCLLSLALAPWADQRWLDAFFRGFRRLARDTVTTLAGGDLARAERLTCDIVVCGAAPKGKALRRDGARPGDAIFVSGRLGGSALGLQTRRGRAWQRHLRPQPRLELGRWLRGRATAAMDLSDGLSLDLHRLCLASGVAAELDDTIPLFPGATLDQALHGGEDYELLFTGKLDKSPDLSSWDVTRIGTIRKGDPGAVTFAGRPLRPLGWDHFRQAVP
ncbi:MAG: thiamine-phosphate kinase [Acidobacteriota bacterium]